MSDSFFYDLPAALPPLPADEIVQIIAQDHHGRIERIISWGQASPAGFWYDQAEDEFVCLLQGEAVLEFASERVTLRSGQPLLIPAHRRHRLAYTSAQPPCIWLCVFSGNQ